MRFFQSAVVALALIGSLVGVSAKKHHKHHSPLFSSTVPSEMVMQDMFTAFMKQYSKTYTHDEFSARFEIFKTNLELIRTHNTLANASYTLGLNEFADLSHAEFKAKYFGYKRQERSFLRSKNVVEFDEDTVVPDTVDWRTKNVVTPVKNQGQCGSCWAFSTTGSTEGAWALAGHGLVSLSEQQLVDCSSSYGNQGCNGGLMDNAFEYIIANGGICTEASYAYTGITGTTCNKCTQSAKISGYKDVTKNNEAQLKIAVAQQPVSIAIEADQMVFQFYSGGILNSASCGTTLDHGVLIVGYGTDSGNAYWTVKNSWGSSWGEAGYIRLSYGNNMCGLATEPSYPSV